MLYNPTSKHTNNGTLSPVDYDARELNLKKAGI
jgi:putative transposase